MGQIYTTLTRPLRTFNIDNRAAKLISKQKPVAAPQYKYVDKQKSLVDKVNPNFLEEHYQKNIQLDQKLKDVFVTSIDPQITKSSETSKLLPQNRFRIDEIIPSYHEPIVIPVGKCSLKQVITFLGQHKRDPITYNVEHIALEYKMDKKIVDDILKHFHLFVMEWIKHEEIEPKDDLEMKLEDEEAKVDMKILNDDTIRNKK